MAITVIHKGSPAWQELAGALNDPAVRKISLEVRPDGVAVKTNEFLWSPTLRGSV